MAEARSIALLGASPSSLQRISLGYDDAGLRIRCETVIPPPAAAARKVLRAVRHLFISAGYTLYPVPPLSALAAGTVFVAYVLGAPPDAWVRSGAAANALWEMSVAALPVLHRSLPVPVIVGLLACGCALAAVLLLAAGERRLLKALLSSKAYLYSARAPGWGVKAWYVVVRALTRGGSAMRTFAFQSVLPRLPVPPLADTVAGYLAHARVLQTDAEYAQSEAQAAAFLAGPGPKLQRYLWLKSLFVANFVTDWWESALSGGGGASCAFVCAPPANPLSPPLPPRPGVPAGADSTVR